MDLNHLHLVVKDLGRSQSFYETMFGFREKVRYPKDLLFLQNAHGFNLALSPAQTITPMPKGIHYGFSVASREALEDVYARGKKLYPECFTMPPMDHGQWGTVMCTDPDGYLFEVFWDQNLRPI